MNATDLANAKYAAQEGRPFAIIAEYHGSNRNNLSGRSDKFWMIERKWSHGPIRVRYGKTGSYGSVSNEGIDLYDALAKMSDKQAKGYRVTGCKAAAAKPSITTAPAPFDAVRSFLRKPDALDLCDALDGMGRLVVTVPARVAHEIAVKYDIHA
jgi:predicted DNA-binding WGR domain protein